MTDVGIGQLKALITLRTLDLAGTNVTDAGLEHLKGLTNLESLFLGETKVTDAGVEKLQHKLPNCEIVK